jgi:uncharacterized membrane protein YphA (DoxX/SURF4 family)
MKGIEHFKHKDALVGYAKSKGIESADTAVIGTGVIMILGGLGVILGTFVQVALALIVVFLVGTSIMMHAYWKETDANKKMSERISYPKELIEQVGAYLATKPFAEVYQLIQSLQQKGEPVKAAAPAEESAP